MYYNNNYLTILIKKITFNDILEIKTYLKLTAIISAVRVWGTVKPRSLGEPPNAQVIYTSPS